MTTTPRARLSLERLEGRWNPAVSANVVFGNLLVTATTATTDLTVTQTGANSFTVTEAGGFSRTVSGVTGDVILRLSGGNDAGVLLDLQENTTPDDVSVSLGGGTNDFTLVNGSVADSLTVLGGSGTDLVTLGDGAEDLSVGGFTLVNLGAPGEDSLTVTGATTLQGSLSAYFANNLDLAEESVIEKNVAIFGGTAGNTVNLDGRVDGSVLFHGSSRAAATDSLSVGGTVGGNLLAYTDGLLGSWYGGSDSVTLTGAVNGSLFLHTGVGNDRVDLGGTAGNRVTVLLGAGNDELTFSGTVGEGTDGLLAVDAGTGADDVTFAAESAVNGSAFVNLGPGNDTFTLEADVTLPAAFISGGLGTDDTFIGTDNAGDGVTIIGFEDTQP